MDDQFGTVYLDSSIIIRKLLRQPGALQGAEWTSAVSSELIGAEVRRSLDRLRLSGSAAEEELANLRELAETRLALMLLVPMNQAVLKRAGGPFPAPLKTLDAIHLATALLWSENLGDIVFMTHDRHLSTAARLCGLRVYPPLV